MISQLKGTLIEKSLGEIVVDVSGVGFSVLMSNISISKLPEVNEEVLVHTYLQSNENGMTLFGFYDKEEDVIFRNLISVSGIGPKIALAALSRYEPSQLVSYIVNQDSTAISKVPGIGKKSAERIILDLKDKFTSESYHSGSASTDTAENPVTQIVLEALLSMGFTKKECTVALSGADKGLDESKLLQYALKRLG